MPQRRVRPGGWLPLVFATLSLTFLLTPTLSLAQVAPTPPSQDGTISNGEYAYNNGPWYMTWDNTNLYIAKTGGAASEPVYIYLDTDPIIPVNGGTNTNGNLTGTTDYGTTPSLPFRADVRIYWDSSNRYIEFQGRDGSGGWNVADTNAGDITLGSSGNGTTREMALRWAALPGLSGRPAAFNWFGYEASTASPYYVYDQTPAANPSGANSNPAFTYYYTVSSTATANATPAFSQTSYTFPGGTISNFDAINVYDFTINQSGGTIVRSGGLWGIGGNLYIGSGSLLNSGSTTTPINVAGNVTIGLNSTLSLSGNIGGDLNVAGNWTNNGTFNPNGRTVTFNGTNSSILSGGTFFNYLTIASGSTLNGPSTGTTTVANGTLTNNGTFNAGNGTLTLNSTNFTNNGTFNPNSGTVISQIANSLNGFFNFNNLTISNGTLTAPSGGLINIAAIFNNNFGSGTFNPNGGTVAFTGGSSQIQSSSSNSLIFNNLTIANGANLGGASSAINVTGNWTNNGSYTANNGIVNFTGNNNQFITGTNLTTFYKMALNMGTSISNTLEVQSPISFPFISGANNLAIANGTFKLSNTSTNISPFQTAFSLPATGGFWVNGGTVGGGNQSWTITGTVRVSSGSLTVGSGINSNSINYNTGANVLIEGGSLNITGRFSPFSAGTSKVNYTQNGGTVTVGKNGSTATSQALFDISAVGSTFIWSGGNIVVANTSSNSQGDYVVKAGTSTVSGGTLQIGNANTPNLTTIYINSNVPVWSMLVDNSTTLANKPTARIFSTPLTVKTDLTITPGTTVNTASGVNLGVSGNLTNNGTLSPSSNILTIGGNFLNNGTFNAGGGTVSFGGSSTQNLSLANPTTFQNLTVSSGVTLVETNSASNATVNGTLTNNGVIRKTQNLTAGTINFGLTGVNLNVTSGTGSLQVDRTDSNAPSAPASLQTGKYWTLTPTGNVSANLSLPLFAVPASTAQACRYSGSGTNWTCGRSAGDATSVTINNINLDSPQTWAVGDNAPAAATLSLSGFPSPVSLGSSGNFTVTVVDGFNNPASNYTGTVHFSSSDNAASLPADYTFSSGDNGQHSFTATFNTAGTQSLTATDTANANLSGTQNGIVVNPAATTLQLQAAPLTAQFGQPVVFTATLTPTQAAGTVSFTNTADNSLLGSGSPDANGQVVITSTTLPVGSNPVQATYGGSNNYGPSQSGIVTVTVTRADTTTSLTVSPASPVNAGQVVTFTIGVNATTGATTLPGGSVAILNGSSPLFTATLSSGGAVYTTTALAPGNYSFTAQYQGDANFNPSSSSPAVPYTVLAVPASLDVSGFAPPVYIGQSSNFTVTVRDGGGQLVPTYAGTVVFTSTDSTAQLPAAYTFGPGDAGSHVFTASFGTAGTQGVTAFDQANPALRGSQDSIQVLKLPTGLTLSATPLSVTLGQPVTFTAVLSPTASGPVTFTNLTNNTMLGTQALDGNGQAVISVTSGLVVGPNSVRVSYGGDATHSASLSNPVTVTVSNGQPVCNQPLMVTLNLDNGVCGTFSYALGAASSGMTITFQLTGSQVITLTNPLTLTVKSGVTVNGGSCSGPNHVYTVLAAGPNLTGDGLKLSGKDTLINLWIRGFKGRQLVIGPPLGGSNRLYCTKVSKN